MSFENTSAALALFMKDLTEGKKQISYAGGTVGDDFVLAPGRITIIGAPPGAGKTALATQIAFEALDRHPELTLHICNAEMEVRELIKRELSRRSGVAHKTISKGLATWTKSSTRRSVLLMRRQCQQSSARCIWCHLSPARNWESSRLSIPAF